MKKIIQITGVLLVITLGFHSCSDSEPKKDPNKINLELVKIENEIYKDINKGNKYKAFELVGTLAHPSDDEWEQKEKTGVLLGDGNYTYSEWWSKRREELRQEVMEMDAAKTDVKENKNASKTLIASLSKSTADFDNSDNKTSDINMELIRLENEVYIQISKGDKDKALELVGYLVHPSTDEWKSKEKVEKLVGFDMSFEYYTYSEWWSKQREELRKEIMNMNIKSTKVNRIHEKAKTEITPSSATSKAPDNDTKLYLKDNILGMYVKQHINGGTMFFKFSKASANRLNVLYQDNMGGNIRIENYSMKSFDEKSGTLTLKSKKNEREIIKVYFKRDPESENGFMLLDNKGLIYNFVSN